MREKLSLTSLLVAACATTPVPAAGLPSRAEVQEAVTRLDRWCWDQSELDPAISCVAGSVREVRRHHCRAEPAPDRPSRILCSYTGVWRLLDRRGRFSECAWLSRSGSGWRIDERPDADVCEF
jgi:hypothetical protein